MNSGKGKSQPNKPPSIKIRSKSQQTNEVNHVADTSSPTATGKPNYLLDVLAFQCLFFISRLIFIRGLIMFGHSCCCLFLTVCGLKLYSGVNSTVYSLSLCVEYIFFPVIWHCLS